MSVDEIKEIPTENLIGVYAQGKGRHGLGTPQKVEDELKRRNIFTEEEWGLIKQKKIKIGMREIAMLASWGSTPANTTRTANGIRRQWVFGRPPHARYVYTENGRVTSIQY